VHELLQGLWEGQAAVLRAAQMTTMTMQLMLQRQHCLPLQQ
jgi:hypothetical protein